MKTRFLGVLVALASLAIVGCEESPTWLVETNDGPMEITRIVNPKTYEDVSVAAIDQLLLVQGVNLNNVAFAFINDVEVVKPTDMTLLNGSILLRVPYTVPTVIDNKLKLTDKQGRTVEAPLEVTVPELVVDGMACEYTPAGSTLVINGSYFDLYNMTPDDGVVLFGDIEAPIVAVNKTSVSVTVPANVPANTTLTLRSDVITVPCPGKYKDEEYLIQNFENKVSDETYKVYYISGPSDPGGEATDPEGISGKYMRYHNTYPGNWDWQSIIYQSFGKRPENFVDHVAEYALKFECYAVKPLADPFVLFNPNGDNPSGYRWGEDASFPTGEWRTYSIPLSETVTLISEWADWPNFIVVFHAAGTGKESYWCIDNLRISKIE